MNTETTQTKPVVEKDENVFLNILFNVILPVFILNKGGKYFSPLVTLMIALALPIGYGIHDLIKSKKINWFSVLGLLNVGISGGLALAGLSGIWFAIKEASFPLILGIFVFFSAFQEKPFIEKVFLNPKAMDTDKILNSLNQDRLSEFHALLKKATLLFSLSFLISAILNFGLAYKIFVPINPALSADEQSSILNAQIASMTSWSYPVIALPSMVIMILIFWYLAHGLKKLTGLKLEEMMIQK